MVYFLVSFLASVVGAICGIGGGVVIKPVLDMLNLGSVATINFLSGCTVLSMSCYSVGKAMLSGESRVERRTGTPLALGAAIGGLIGKQVFSVIRTAFENQSYVSIVQAICLGLITIGTLIYTLNKGQIATKHTESRAVCAVIGILLGIMSSFLGIGGGPINLVVLYFFFSMDTKTAAANSLYIVLFSQIASLVSTLVTQTVPEFQFSVLIIMVVGGIGGGVIGRRLNRILDNKAVDKLFIGLMILIVGICIYNILHYISI